MSNNEWPLNAVVRFGETSQVRVYSVSGKLPNLAPGDRSNAYRPTNASFALSCPASSCTIGRPLLQASQSARLGHYKRRKVARSRTTSQSTQTHAQMPEVLAELRPAATPRPASVGDTRAEEEGGVNAVVVRGVTFPLMVCQPVDRSP